MQKASTERFNEVLSCFWFFLTTEDQTRVCQGGRSERGGDAKTISCFSQKYVTENPLWICVDILSYHFFASLTLPLSLPQFFPLSLARPMIASLSPSALQALALSLIWEIWHNQYAADERYLFCPSPDGFICQLVTPINRSTQFCWKKFLTDCGQELMTLIENAQNCSCRKKNYLQLLF